MIFYILRVARFLQTNMGVANQKSLRTPVVIYLSLSLSLSLFTSFSSSSLSLLNYLSFRHSVFLVLFECYYWYVFLSVTFYISLSLCLSPCTSILYLVPPSLSLSWIISLFRSFFFSLSIALTLFSVSPLSDKDYYKLQTALLFY